MKILIFYNCYQWKKYFHFLFNKFNILYIKIIVYLIDDLARFCLHYFEQSFNYIKLLLDYIYRINKLLCDKEDQLQTLKGLLIIIIIKQLISGIVLKI